MTIKTHLKLYTILFFMTTLLCCSSDDSEKMDDSVQLKLEDFSLTVDELPINDNDFLGTLESNMEGTFNLLSVIPAGALSVNTDSGDITIADASLFNYEINSTISATVEITTGTETDTATITIDLNNIDEIWFYLTDSKQDYLNANNGEWILVSEVEYDALASNLDAVTKVATSDDSYDSNDMIFGANSPATWANDNGVIIPDNGFIFAIKYHSADDNASGTKIKQSSTSVSDGYEDLGNVLPLHDTGEHFFVLKGNNNMTTNEGYLAIYSPVSIGFKSISGTIYAGEPNDANTFFNLNLTNSLIMYQGLSTTFKQWE